MKPFLTRIAAASVGLLGSLLVAGCGGGATADTTPAVKITSVKVFGDSLQDSGTFGYKFTVQGTDSLIYVERIAANYGQTLCNFFTFTGTTFAPNTAKTGCTNFAIGGGRITYTGAGASAANPLNIGVQMAAIWALLSAGGIGAGLALKQPVQEFFNYLTILLDRPFQTGQWIQVNGITARVERVGVRSTRLRNLSGEAVVMGNSLLTSAVVTNCDELQQRRVVSRFALQASADPDALEQMPARVAQLVRNQPDARFERCHCLELQGNALIVELVYGLEGVDLERHRLVQQRVTLGLNRLLQELALPLASN